jgi:hypothetical protein
MKFKMLFIQNRDEYLKFSNHLLKKFFYMKLNCQFNKYFLENELNAQNISLFIQS